MVIEREKHLLTANMLVRLILQTCGREQLKREVGSLADDLNLTQLFSYGPIFPRSFKPSYKQVKLSSSTTYTSSMLIDSSDPIFEMVTKSF